MTVELNGLSTRLLKMVRNTNDLRVRKTTQRDEALLRYFDASIEKLMRAKKEFEVMATSVVPAAAEVVEATLEAKAALFIELKSDETFLAGRLKRITKAAAA